MGDGDDAASLYARYRRERRADVRPRLHALWLVRTGREAAEVLGVDERTVQRWLGWYRAGGLAPIEGRRAGSQGASSYLTVEQRAELADEVATGRFRTAAEIRRWVEERWGVKVHQRLQLRYDWWYLFVAVGGQAGTVSWTWLDSMKATDLVPLMEALRTNAPIDAIVWDGASSHRADAVRAVGVPVIDLPPYGPELNPAERLFEEVRRHVEGRVYATLADKVAAVNAFLDELDAARDRVRRLCGWDWINAASATLPQPLENAA